MADFPFGVGVDTYNIKEVKVSIGGIIVTGFGENDAVTIDYSEDLWGLTVGCDGEMARSKNNNSSGTITISCLQVSGINIINNAIRILDQYTLLGDVVVPVFITDIRRGEVIGSNDCWIMKHPSYSFNKSVGEREWTFQAPNLTVVRADVAEAAAMLDYRVPSMTADSPGGFGP